MNVERIAKALGGEVASSNSVLAPGPGHSRRNPFNALSSTLLARRKNHYSKDPRKARDGGEL